MSRTSPLLFGLPPISDESSRILILGSFPSAKSLEKQEYYANPQNDFWRIMEMVLGIERSAPYSARVEAVLSKGIAVWDVIASCQRLGSADDNIEEATANPLVALVPRHPRLRRVIFNGGKAERTAKEQLPEMFDTPTLSFHRFLSTSSRVMLQRKLPDWKQLENWSQVRQ